MIDQRLCLNHEGFRANFLVGNIAGDSHKLLLALKQAQPQPLLGVFHIASDGLLFAVYFFNSQIAKRGNHRRQKKHHGQQRTQRNEAVLARWRLLMPPVAPKRQRRRACGVI